MVVDRPHPDSSPISLNCAVITVSDTREAETDRSGQLLQQQLQDAQAFENLIQQPTTLVYALKGAGETPAASGRVVFNAEQRQAIVVVRDLPKLPSGQLYRLWALTAKGEVVYCGQFDTQKAGTAVERLRTAQAPESLSVAEMRITQEVANTPPVPKGPAVMTSLL